MALVAAAEGDTKQAEQLVHCWANSTVRRLADNDSKDKHVTTQGWSMSLR
jgi:hypothetical protein